MSLHHRVSGKKNRKTESEDHSRHALSRGGVGAAAGNAREGDCCAHGAVGSCGGLRAAAQSLSVLLRSVGLTSAALSSGHEARHNTTKDAPVEYLGSL